MSAVRTTAVGDARRAQVVAAAAELVAEGGLEALTFGALEGRLPFTRGVITWHFADKAALLRAVLESALDAIDADTAAEGSPGSPFPEKVGAVVESRIRAFLRHGEATRVIVAFWSGAGSAPEIAPLFQRWRRQAANLARAAMQSGEAREDLDPEAFGALLVGLVIGVVVQAQYAGPLELEPLIALAITAGTRSASRP